MSLSPGSTVIDPEKLKQLMAGGPNVPMIAPPLGGAPTSPQLPALNFKQRQALPTVSEGTPAGSSAFYGNKIARIEDQEANPRGSADNHSGWPGKIEHVLSKIGNIAGDVADPAAMARIPGTDLNRQAQEKQLGAQQELAGQRETQARQQAATEAYQTGELADRAKGRQLESDKQSFEENKPGTPEQEAMRDLTQRNNPATGQPYTPEEAAVKYAQDIEDTKPDKTKEETPHTVTMTGPDKKPYEYQFDPKGNYSDPNQGYGQWKKIGPAKPEANGGMIGTLTPLLGPNGQLMGTMNTKTGEIKPITNNPLTSGEGGAPGATTSSGSRLSNTERNQFATQYIKPATDIEQNYQKFLGARREYDANPATGAASMAATAQHLGSTFGSIKGAQMGEHMIQEHVDAIGLFDRLGRYADQLQSGQQLSKSQWDDFQKLITNTRDIQWETTAREAARRGQPVDFLPPDVHIQLSDSAGHTRYVRGDQVQQYLAQGAKIQ
jgi:hypothetical protein